LSTLPRVWILLWNWEIAARKRRSGFFELFLDSDCLIECCRWFKYQLLNRSAVVDSIERRIRFHSKFHEFCLKIRENMFPLLFAYRDALISSKAWIIDSDKASLEFETEFKLTCRFLQIGETVKSLIQNLFTDEILFLFLKYHFTNNIPITKNQNEKEIVFSKSPS
jgi:hypothetical protein